MINMKYLAALSLPLLLLVAGSAADKDTGNKKCPISGKAIKKDVSLNVNGKSVYFCCDGCPKAYKKKIRLAEDKGQKCIFTGKPANPAKMLIHKKAEEISFCCNNCKGKWAEQNKIAFKDGKNTCPISGKPGKDETAISVNGEKVVFCCGNCPKKYKEDLAVAVANDGKCPISGKPGKPETAQILVEAKEINFCCGNCQKKYMEKHFAKDKKGKGKVRTSE
jgi:hypothetical protein